MFFFEVQKLAGKFESHKMSVHTKARPFVCRFGCGAASSDKGNRKKHEITKHRKVFAEVEGEEMDGEWGMGK